MILPILYVAPSDKGGRGVFTSQPIAAGTTIEISPVLVFSSKERACLEETKLYDYVFEWGERKRQVCLALGYISLYNHDYTSNCDYDMDFDSMIMTIRTVRAVKKGEELCINYNADPNDQTPVWFHTKKSPAPQSK
jgi:SET domain-containing protein